MESESASTGKLLLIVIVVAVVAAIAATLIQVLILGKSHVAVTGATVGAMSALLAIKVWKKKPAPK